MRGRDARVQEWSEGQYHLMEALFNFREALQSPTAFVYDPNICYPTATQPSMMLCMSQLITQPYGLRAAQHFEKGMEIQAEEADIYCHIRRRREARLAFSFDYEEQQMPQARFEQMHIRRPIALHGLKLRAHLPGNDCPFSP